MNTSRLYLFIALLVFAFGCRKENITTETEIKLPPPSVFIESEIYGLVTDQNNIPIEDAEVRWGTEFTSTDQNGVFKLISTVPDRIAVLNIKKDNYFEANQSLSAFKESSIKTKVQLIERTLSGTISASNGGAINVSGGGKVDFEANSFKDESGNAYLGEVSIYATYLDPTRPDLREVMPGNLMALNTSEELQYLQSFGMINVELEGSSGEKLQISQAATLTTPVPNSLAINAPNTIPLWHFDTDSGFWVEEGEAILQGDEYVGEVSHFSWWNCDYPRDVVFLEGKVNAGIASPIVDVRITILSSGSTGTVTSTDKGDFSGYVPKDELLLLEILDGCGNVVYSEEIGPFSVDTQLPTITIDLSGLELINISGFVVNCDGLPISNGYVIVQGISTSISAIFLVNNDGSFTGSILNCGDVEELSVIAIDYTEETQSTSITVLVQENINMGTINACAEDIVAGVTIIINGASEIYTPCNATINSQNGTIIYEINFPMVLTAGTNLYKITIVDWAGDPNNPVYVVTYEIQSLDNPEFSYTFQSDDILKVSDNEMTGDILNFVLSNVFIIKDENNGSVTTYNECTVDIKALVQ